MSPCEADALIRPRPLWRATGRGASLALVGGLLLLVGGFSAVPGARAQEPQGADRWAYDAAIYLWAADIESTTRRGNSIDIGFDEVFDNLNLGFMGSLQASKDRWFVGADLIFVDVSAGKAGTLGSTGVALNADVDMTTWVLNLQGGRNLVQAERGILGVVLGARFLDSTSQLTLRVGSLPLTPGAKQKVSAWDLTVGLRGHLNLTDHWFIPYHADVGAGQSELTWQGMGGIGYRFNWGRLVFAYRHTAWTFRSDEDWKDLTLSGPMLGAVFSF